MRLPKEIHMPGVSRICSVLVLASMAGAGAAAAQGTLADYQRAMGLRDTWQGLAIGVPEGPTWVGQSDRFWFRRTVKGGNEFVLVNPENKSVAPAFDHARLAEALSKAANARYTAATLPFTSFTFIDNERAIQFVIGPGGAAAGGGGGRGGGPGFDGPPMWKCSIESYVCTPPSAGRGAGRGRGGANTGLAGPVRPPFDVNGVDAKKSPDGKFEALVQNYNLAVRPAGSRETKLLSTDGSEGGYYDPRSIEWSPDSTKVAVYKVTPGYRRFVHYVTSSPEDQLQPEDSTMQYAKPGDVLDVERPFVFNVGSGRGQIVDSALFPNAYDMTPLVWRKDSLAFTFEYNQRGHQVYRVIEVNGETAKARAVISEEPKTFFCYSGKKFRHDTADGKESIWMSERDGWNHLYLYDAASGAVKSQITRGDWAVRSVVWVDEVARQIVFSANGMYPGKDPYFVHYYRINFNGTGLTPLTTADANHTVTFSPNRVFYVDSYSRVDLAPIVELHRTSDASLAMTVDKADIAELVKAGWKAPEVFVAKGRDGKTDIWGVIYRPTNFNPSKKYPVLENIYAGPQGSFVPKSFQAFNAMQAQAEIGFIVVQIDGMGTNYRSKAFHDVAWRNLKDAGFPDRILWHKAVAAKYPSYDITRVGLYGTSAGGQNSLGGLLFFPDFYKAAVSAAGCHDNRMDKIWWNEQWMGWPIGEQYAESSNVDNAWRLQGKVMLVVGEMDHNVDPSSTMQVVNQLIKHNKDFDLLVVPGMDHGSGGAFGEHKRYDFFTRNLLGMTPPEWKAVEDATKRRVSATSVN
jgi:dipeptidyl aminopeptidase/acylaminoacyl peptidase